MSSPAKILTRNKQIEAALNNEQVTRRRVEVLETRTADTNRALEELRGTVRVHTGVLQRGFLGRMRWLVTGR